MRRHPALKDLSRDHYFALVQTLRVRKMADGATDAPSEQEVLDGILEYWITEGRLHFREEEEIVLPRLDPADDEDGLVERVREDHEWLRQAFDDLKRLRDTGQPATERLIETGRRLGEHARLEEDALFPKLQETVSGRELEEMRRQSRAFRMANRGRDALGPRHQGKETNGSPSHPTS